VVPAHRISNLVSGNLLSKSRSNEDVLEKIDFDFSIAVDDMIRLRHPEDRMVVKDWNGRSNVQDFSRVVYVSYIYLEHF
jgi:hypothetical protein